MGRGLQQELTYFRRTFVITPVADPDYVVGLLHRGARIKYSRIGSLMQCPNPRNPKALPVNFPQCFSERNYAVETVDGQQPDQLR